MSHKTCKIHKDGAKDSNCMGCNEEAIQTRIDEAVTEERNRINDELVIEAMEASFYS